MSLFDDRLKSILPDLGHIAFADSAYVTSLTGVIPRPAAESVLASARDLIAHGGVTVGGLSVLMRLDIKTS